MKRIIGFTDSINVCECCGKANLKGTYCIELDGEELYYGSTCAFKNHGLSIDEQKELKTKFTKAQKNQKLYDLHIKPLKEKLSELLQNSFDIEYEKLHTYSKNKYDSWVNEYNRVIELRCKKYKITLI